MSTLILYLGNPIVRNDQIGFIIGRKLSDSLAKLSSVEIKEFTGSPLDFISAVARHKKLIIIDSISTGKYAKGTVVLYARDEILKAGSAFYLHGMNIAEAFNLMMSFGLRIPEEICLIGIEAGSIDEFGSSCDPDLSANLAGIEKSVIEIVTSKQLSYRSIPRKQTLKGK